MPLEHVIALPVPTFWYVPTKVPWTPGTATVMSPPAISAAVNVSPDAKVPTHVFPVTMHVPTAQVVPVGTSAVEVSTIFPPVLSYANEEEHVTTGSCAMEFPPMVLGL